jgi:TM2 domain-containing membrane protein YozV
MSCALGLALVWQLVAAGPGPEPAPQPDSVPSLTDTLRLKTDTGAAPVLVDTLKAKPARADTASEKKARTVTTGKAMLLSALLPGGGQFYCRSYVKGAIYGTAELALAGITVFSDQQMRKAYSNYTADTLSLRNRRNAFLWWTGAVWAFSIADAYVSASMYGFKEEQKFEASISPLQVGICYRF